MRKVLYIGYRSWGNAIYFLDDRRTRIYGYRSDRFENGSFIISNPENKESELFMINNIEFCKDPDDMFFADVESLGPISKDLIYGSDDKLIEYLSTFYEKPSSNDNNFFRLIYLLIILSLAFGYIACSAMCSNWNFIIGEISNQVLFAGNLFLYLFTSGGILFLIVFLLSGFDVDF